LDRVEWDLSPTKLFKLFALCNSLSLKLFCLWPMPL
jgi:hypothetical protein